MQIAPRMASLPDLAAPDFVSVALGIDPATLCPATTDIRDACADATGRIIAGIEQLQRRLSAAQADLALRSDRLRHTQDRLEARQSLRRQARPRG